MIMPDVMTIKETAAVLRVSEKTLRSIIRDGLLPAIWVRGSIRILASDLNEFIKNGGVSIYDR